MKEFALIGNPVSHSLSKEYFNQRFKKEGIRANYSVESLSSIQFLPQFLIAHPNLLGFNVTSPYKESIIPYLDELDSLATELQAVNTVICTSLSSHKKVLKGYNTDVLGLFRSFEILLKDFNGKALIFGTGGAAKAVERALSLLQIESRKVSRRQDEKKLFLTYASLSKDVLEEYTLLVNATPLGMHSREDEMPCIPYEFIGARHICYDLIYAPEETLFLQKAKEKGAMIKNGLEMLYFQAEENWKLWASSFYSKE